MSQPEEALAVETVPSSKSKTEIAEECSEQNETNDGVPVEGTFDDKVRAEMEKSKGMKVGELKLKLQARGILTSTFCEKTEFVRAYAESVVKDATVVVEDADDDADHAFGLSALSRNEDGEDDDSEQDAMAHLPLYVEHRVEKLKELHEERENTMKEYLAERATLEAKYQALRQPIYQKRADIVNGKLDDEISKEHVDEADEGEKLAGVPQFWVCALGHMNVVAETITQQDVDCLEHIIDITCADDESGEGFVLSFHFAPNEYFHDTVLTKKYEVPNLLLADEPILKNVVGCEIKWKPGKSLTYREVTKKQRGKGKNAGQLRTVASKERSESFFHFFTPPKMPSLDSMDEEEADRLEHAFDQDYDMAQAFRSHVIPKAVLWFTGQAMEQEMEAAMEGMSWPGADGSTPTGDEKPECNQS